MDLAASEVGRRMPAISTVAPRTCNAHNPPATALCHARDIDGSRGCSTVFRPNWHDECASGVLHHTPAGAMEYRRNRFEQVGYLSEAKWVEYSIEPATDTSHGVVAVVCTGAAPKPPAQRAEVHQIAAGLWCSCTEDATPSLFDVARARIPRS
jgi:hypothetical protein